MIEELHKRIEEQRMLLAGICCPARNINTVTLESVLSLGIEIAREGREGRKIGTCLLYTSPSPRDRG
jgi:DNA integrity scanning protein DisA with diadenylate cyclase activity